jgi:hypothetical protein
MTMTIGWKRWRWIGVAEKVHAHDVEPRVTKIRLELGSETQGSRESQGKGFVDESERSLSIVIPRLGGWLVGVDVSVLF